MWRSDHWVAAAHDNNAGLGGLLPGIKRSCGHIAVANRAC
jgi:hypothetical protein